MKNTATVNKNRKKTIDKDDKRPDYNLVLNLDEPIPVGKHYIGLWIRENKETAERFMCGKIDIARLKPVKYLQEKSEQKLPHVVENARGDEFANEDIPF